jgi:hypothetical protein
VAHLAVDLSQALRVVGSHVCLHGSSDASLVQRVREAPNFVAGDKALSAVPGLDGGIFLRPVEGLHWLSYATRPRYQDDLLDVYLHWALIRYIGLFELRDDGDAGPSLAVSQPGQRIRGNQRRVTSEEMGIGFGALLASRWFAQAGEAGLPIGIVDVDAALADRYIFAGGSRHSVRAVADRRPDYLLIAPDPAARRRYRVRALECKGTSSGARYAVQQLASAVEQLAGISVGGRVPQGLAVSTITANSQMSYLAIDPGEDDEPSYEVSSATIEQAAGFQLEDDIKDAPPALLANASVRASWAALADFGGNLGALDRWAPTVMRTRLDRQQRQRVTFDTPYGTARGISVTIGLDGQRLTVRYAIEEAIDQQMDHSPEAIADAQTEFAERLDSPDLAEDASFDSLYSATPDGSIFSLSLE